MDRSLVEGIVPTVTGRLGDKNWIELTSYDVDILTYLEPQSAPTTGATGTSVGYDPTIQLVRSLIFQVQTLAKEVEQLREELSSRPLVSSTVIYDLGSDQIGVQVPIPILLEETDDEALARWPETRISGMGATLAEAIINLKRTIAENFQELSAHSPDSLGDIATMTLRLMSFHLRAES